MITTIAVACSSPVREYIKNKNDDGIKENAITVQMLREEFNKTLEFEKKTNELIRKWESTNQLGE